MAETSTNYAGNEEEKKKKTAARVDDVQKAVEELQKDIKSNQSISLDNSEMEVMRKIEDAQREYNAEARKRKEEQQEEQKKEKTSPDFDLSDEEMETLSGIKAKYDKNKVTHTIESSFKDAFSELKQQLKNVDDLNRVKKDWYDKTGTYAREYIEKQIAKGMKEYIDNSKRSYENLMKALQDLKLNLIACSEKIELEDTALNNALMMINIAGVNTSEETMEQIATTFKGNLSALRILRDAAAAKRCPCFAFDKLLFNPLQEIGRLEQLTERLFGPAGMQIPGFNVSNISHAVGDDESRSIAIYMGSRLKYLANLCNVYLSQWDTQLVEDEEYELFSSGLSGKDFRRYI